MATQDRSIPVVESSVLPTTFADCVVHVRQIGPMTHIVFAETRPSLYNFTSDGQPTLERVPSVRLAVPNELVSFLARTILAGAISPQWVMSHEDDTLGVRKDN